MKLKPIRLLNTLMVGTVSLMLWFIAVPAQAACSGCLCPGDPCNLCPLPAIEGAEQKADEPEVCARIKEAVPPTPHPRGSNEHFDSLDRSVIECVKNGGDVIVNSRRNEEFPSKHYCKP